MYKIHHNIPFQVDCNAGSICHNDAEDDFDDIDDLSELESTVHIVLGSLNLLSGLYLENLNSL